MKNYNHNLIHQLSEILDGIWRCEHFYQKDAEEGNCESCKKLWKEVEVDLNKIADMIKKEIGRHIEERKTD